MTGCWHVSGEAFGKPPRLPVKKRHRKARRYEGRSIHKGAAGDDRGLLQYNERVTLCTNEKPSDRPKLHVYNRPALYRPRLL